MLQLLGRYEIKSNNEIALRTITKKFVGVTMHLGELM